MAKEIKYADKSKGQPELSILFDEAKEIMRPFARGNYVLQANKPGSFGIYYNKQVEMFGKKYPELMLASLLIQKGYLGFYYFPVYIEDGLKKKLAPELLKTLKGKTCFHLKKNDQPLLKQIGPALQAGIDYFGTRGWI